MLKTQLFSTHNDAFQWLIQLAKISYGKLYSQLPFTLRYILKYMRKEPKAWLNVNKHIFIVKVKKYIY